MSLKQELTAKWKTAETIRASVIGAVFFGLIMAVAPLAFGPLQFRVADILDLLPYDRKYGGRAAVVGILVGGGLTNFFSPYGPAEILGTLSGVVSFLGIWWLGIRFKGNDLGKIIAAVWCIAVTEFFISYLMLHVLFQCPLIEVLISVGIEMVILMALSIGLLKMLERFRGERGWHWK